MEHHCHQQWGMAGYSHRNFHLIGRQDHPLPWCTSWGLSGPPATASIFRQARGTKSSFQEICFWISFLFRLEDHAGRKQFLTLFWKPACSDPLSSERQAWVCAQALSAAARLEGFSWLPMCPSLGPLSWDLKIFPCSQPADFAPSLWLCTHAGEVVFSERPALWRDPCIYKADINQQHKDHGSPSGRFC